MLLSLRLREARARIKAAPAPSWSNRRAPVDCAARSRRQLTPSSLRKAANGGRGSGSWDEPCVCFRQSAGQQHCTEPEIPGGHDARSATQHAWETSGRGGEAPCWVSRSSSERPTVRVWRWSGRCAVSASTRVAYSTGQIELALDSSSSSSRGNGTAGLVAHQNPHEAAREENLKQLLLHPLRAIVLDSGNHLHRGTFRTIRC